MIPILPVLLAQHQILSYTRVGITQEILHAVLQVADSLQGPRLEVAITGRDKQMRDTLRTSDENADPLLYSMLDDETKYPSAALEAAIFIAR